MNRITESLGRILISGFGLLMMIESIKPTSTYEMFIMGLIFFFVGIIGDGGNGY